MDTLVRWSCPSLHGGETRSCTVSQNSVLGSICESWESLRNEELSPNLDDWYDGHSAESRKALFKQKAWQLALMPAKTLGMNTVMLVFVGTGGLFGLIFIGYAMLTAVKLLFSVNKVFDDLERSAGGHAVNTIFQRFLFILISMAFIAFFFYQCAKLGLLPGRSFDTDTELVLFPVPPYI